MDAPLDFNRFPFDLVPLAGRDDDDLVQDIVNLFVIETVTRALEFRPPSRTAIARSSD